MYHQERQEVPVCLLHMDSIFIIPSIPSKPQGERKCGIMWEGGSRRAWVSSGDMGCLPAAPAVPGSLLDLKSVIEKVTGKPALENYGFYGCYCGWGGHGTPLDGTDW